MTNLAEFKDPGKSAERIEPTLLGAQVFGLGSNATGLTATVGHGLGLGFLRAMANFCRDKLRGQAYLGLGAILSS